MCMKKWVPTLEPDKEKPMPFEKKAKPAGKAPIQSSNTWKATLYPGKYYVSRGGDMPWNATKQEEVEDRR
jgi:hypothetical protein